MISLMGWDRNVLALVLYFESEDFDYEYGKEYRN